MTYEEWQSRYLEEEGSNYSQEKRLAFVTDYLHDPNLAAVCRKHDVPYQTAFQWKSKSWWHNMVEEILANYKDELLAKQRQIIHRTYDEIGERLENGDESYIPNEGHVRTKVKANHLATIADVTLKANQLLQGKATQISHVTIESLADKLRTITQEAIDITPNQTIQQAIQIPQDSESD
jgi:vacuolar-type H+-ATPase subunit E/Vma4